MCNCVSKPENCPCLTIDWTKPIKRRGDTHAVRVVGVLAPDNRRVIAGTDSNGREWIYEVNAGGYIYSDESKTNNSDIVNAPPPKKKKTVRLLRNKLNGSVFTSTLGCIGTRYDVIGEHTFEYEDK